MVRELRAPYGVTYGERIQNVATTRKEAMVLQINRAEMTAIAEENGWMHTRGRLAGTINAAAMAQGIGVHTATVTRAYDTGSVGLKLLENLAEHSGRTYDQLLKKRAA